MTPTEDVAARVPVPPPQGSLGFRPWVGPEDLDGMAAVNTALRNRLDVVEPIDVEAMRHRYTHLVNSDPTTDCILVEREGVTLGYARAEWHDLTAGDRVYDLTAVIDPAAWGLGIAATFVRWGEARSRSLALEHPSDRVAHFANYAIDGDAELVGALQSLGYAAVRWDAEMLRPDLDDLPAVEVPDGYHLRAPEEAELAAVHQMMVEAFAEHWGEYEAEDQRIEDWIEDPRFRRDLVVVAWAGDRPAAVVCNILETTANGTLRGLLDGVATHPDHRRRGLARATIARSLELLRGEGAASAYLGVDTDNHNRALALYESCGFRKVSGGTSFRKPFEPGEPRGIVPDGPRVEGLALRHATPADWDAIAEVQNAARRADGLDEVRTGESLASDHPDSDSFHLTRDILLAEIGRKVVAFAFGYRVQRDGLLVGEGWGDVHPDHRRCGIGTALARSIRDRLTAELADDPRPGRRELRSYAMEQERGAIALLQAEGYVPIRYGFEMRRYLTGILPEHPLPVGLEMRPVTEDQYRAIFDADNEAFEDHWGHRAPEEADFQARFHGPEMTPSIWCVAWDGDQVAGVVMNAIFRDENEALGIRRAWLEHVSVRRQWRGRGVAKALCAASFRVLREEGMDEAWLGVDGSNPTGALQLYDGLGFSVVRRWQAYGRPLERPAPAGWRSGDPDG